MVLITTRGLLACLQLLQVEITNLHVTVVLLQTSGEGSGIGVTSSGLFLVVLLGSLLRGFSRSRRASEHRSDTSTKGVADGGTDGNTGGSRCHLTEQAWALLRLNRLRNGSWMLLWRGHRSSSCVGRSGLRSNWSGSSLSSHDV